MAANDAAKTAIDELSKALSVKSIIGEPIEMDDKIILPITKMGIGLGAGVDLEVKGIGGMTGKAGGGGGISPVAVVVIFKGIEGPEGIRVIPLVEPSAHAGLAESMTHIASTFLSRLNTNKEAGEGAGEGHHPPRHTSQAARVKIE
jgi:uncharacterized spore protein YtfJ